MSGFSKDLKSKKITAKINNMKRRRDSSPMSRKNRHRSTNRDDSSSDTGGSPRNFHRRSRSSPNHITPRYSERDDFGHSSHSDRSHSTYNMLCISGLHHKVCDDDVKHTLYREFRKFGEFSIRISDEFEERVAYVYFKNSEDARLAKNSKPKINLLDKIAIVAPVYENQSLRDNFKSRTRHSRSRSLSPVYHRYDQRTTIPPELHRQHDGIFERSPLTYPPMLPPQHFRNAGLPLLHHHEYMMPRIPLLQQLIPIHPHLERAHPLYGSPRHFMPPYELYHHMRQDTKDTFPNYLNHIPPENDPLATRTLFVGNLETTITSELLQRLFGRFGIVEDVDIKRPLPGCGNAFAFVRFKNLDMAHRAKVEMSGNYIGKLQCKIGYGKSAVTQRIWISGLGPRTSSARLEQEFDRFGVIKKIEYNNNDTSAYIRFENIDAAIAAVRQMRGVVLDGSEYKLRTDFAADDVYSIPSFTFSSKSPHDDIAASAGDLRELLKKQEKDPTKLINYSPSSPLELIIDTDLETDEMAIQSAEPVGSVRTLSDLTRKCTDIWQGSLALKSSQYPVKCHLTFGSQNIIESLMKDEDGKSTLRITQRLRLNNTKLDDVSKRIIASHEYAIFLVMPCSTSSIANDDPLVQIKPLRNLVSYLKQKEAAGVITLEDKDSGIFGVLYAFPFCEYSINLLERNDISLNNETLENDHLIILVVSDSVS